MLKNKILLSLLLISLSTTSVIGSTKISLEEQLNDTVALPINYQDKVFNGGTYVLIQDTYKVVLKNNTTYLPIRLMTYALSKEEEVWEAHWDSKKPDEVMLYCYSRPKLAEGIYSHGTEAKIKIHLKVGSKKMIYNGEAIELSATPEKIDGRMVLPVRAIGEALKKQITYKNGLVFISNNSLAIGDAKAEVVIKDLKMRLEDPRKQIYPSASPNAVVNIEGKTYYVSNEYDAKTNMTTQKLYRHEAGKDAVLVKQMPSYISLQQPFVKDSFYYFKKNDNRFSLHVLNLKELKETKVADLNSDFGVPTWVSTVVSKTGKTYLTAHYGDFTMGHDTLFAIENGKSEKLMNAKLFTNLIFEEGKIYYSTMENYPSGDNLFVYDEKTKTISKLGEAGYVYDINRTLTEQGGTSYSISMGITLLDGNLYTIGYEAKTNKTQGLYKINNTTNQTKKLTESTSQFWIVKDKIYYVDNNSYLHSMDLEGNNRTMVVNSPITKIKYNHENFYYTVSNGFYKYTLATRGHSLISSKKVKEFFIHPSRIYVIITGYDAGLYKIENGSMVQLENQPIRQSLFDGEYMIYEGIYEKNVKVVR